MKKINFDPAWRFFLGDPPDARWTKLNDSAWQVVDLPHDWSIGLERTASCSSGNANGYFPMGRGWYQKTFAAPAEWQDQQVRLEFEGVYMNAEAWLNGHFLGRHPYGYTSFTYDLTPYLKIGAENVLKVMVDNAAQLNSRWYSGSGIYRHAWLRVGGAVHFSMWGVAVSTPEITAEVAHVEVVTRVENQSNEPRWVTVRSTVLDSAGAPAGMSAGRLHVPAGQEGELCQIVPVHQPRLWSLESPVLYRVASELAADETVIDTESTDFGIRRLEFSAADGFRLNGQPLKLKGGCVHHDNGILGSASFDRSEERKVELLKASGYNAIRCAHNPPAPAFLDACDRLGMLVIDEAFDCWLDGKNPHDYHVSFADWWQRDLASMVQRDRNHPSIILWSIGNELIERGRPEGHAVARELAGFVRALEPTRPVIAAMCGTWGGDFTWDASAGFFAALDVAGYNYLWQEYAGDHAKFPDRMMVGTESFPLEAFENWTSVMENNHILGDFVWTSLDYLGEAGIGRVYYGEQQGFLGTYPWHHAYCGDLDLCGFKRPQSHYRDAVWGEQPKVFIAVHAPAPEGKPRIVTQWGWPDVSACWNWPDCAGSTLQVDVYSNCEEVELTLNGSLVAVQPSGRTQKHIATFQVPYMPGELRAVGRTGGKALAEHAIKTHAQAAALRLSPDRPVIPAAPGGLCYVTVELADAGGLLAQREDRPVHFKVEGPGELLAVGSGNPVSTEAYRGDQRSTFWGCCLVVVKSTGQPGEICLSAAAEGVSPAAVTIRAA